MCVHCMHECVYIVYMIYAYTGGGDGCVIRKLIHTKYTYMVFLACTILIYLYLNAWAYVYIYILYTDMLHAYTDIATHSHKLLLMQWPSTRDRYYGDTITSGNNTVPA